MWNKEKLTEQRKEFSTVPIYKKGAKRDCSNYRGLSLLSSTYNILSHVVLSRLTPYAEEIIGDHQYDIDITGQLLIMYSVFIKYLRENGNTMKQGIAIVSLMHCLMFKQTYDSVCRRVLYKILIEFGIPTKPVRLIKMSLNETYIRVRVDKHLSDMLPIKNGSKQDALSPLLFNFALEHATRMVQTYRRA